MEFHKENKIKNKKEDLFDFGEIEMEGGVDPSKNLRSADEICRIHHPDIRRHCCFLLLSFFVGYGVIIKRLRFSLLFFLSSFFLTAIGIWCQTIIKERKVGRVYKNERREERDLSQFKKINDGFDFGGANLTPIKPKLNRPL